MAEKEASNPQPYIPAGRYSHVAATIDSMLYVWGGWRKDTPQVHSGVEKTAITSTVDVLDLEVMEWAQKQTAGDPPLGVAWCAFTVVGKRIIIYGGYCQHDYCYHNSLHELDTSTDMLTWKQLADDDEPGAPMKKWDCGLAAFDFTGEMISVFGGYGDLKLKQSQAGASYFKNDYITVASGWTNEIHCFKSGKWSSPKVTGERPPPACGFSYAKILESDVAMFGGYSKTATLSHRINDLYILRFTDTTTHCIRVPKPEKVQWPVERSHHSSCVLSSRQTNSTQIISIGGEGNEWEQHNKQTSITFSDVWIGDIDKTGKIAWEEVTITPDEQFMRQRHSATAWRLDASHVIVVVYGGLETMIRDERDARQENMTNDTRILEFELQKTRVGKEAWVLIRAVDLAHYKKSVVVQLRKRVRELEHSLEQQAKCIEDKKSANVELRKRVGELEEKVASLEQQAKCTQVKTNRLISIPCPDSEPSMETLIWCNNGEKTIRIVEELASDWQEIGILLKFTTSQLKVISKDNQSQVECCRCMLSQWIDGQNNDDRPKTWETLLYVIKTARWGSLAASIEEIVFAISK